MNDGVLGVHDLDFGGSDIDTAFPDDDAGIRVAFLSQVGQSFCLAPCGAPLLLSWQ